jgi:hypothetical protein
MAVGGLPSKRQGRLGRPKAHRHPTRHSLLHLHLHLLPPLPRLLPRPLLYTAAVISTAPYISTHIFVLYFFFKNLSPLSLYTHRHLDDIISQACYRHRRHIPEERHTYKVHTLSHKLLQGGRFYQDPTRSHTNLIQFHTISYTQQARTFYYKRWLLLDII